MDVKSKPASRPTLTRDNFMVDAVRPKTHRISYGDGFRFGIGLITAQLLIVLIVAALAWALIAAFKLR